MSDFGTSGEAAGGKTLVAEYVLGLLDSRAHARVAARIDADQALQREERFWRARLARLDDAFEETAPPPQILGRIEARLFGVPEKRSGLAALWDNLALWRGVSAGALAIAVLAIGFSALTPETAPDTSSGELAVQLVAALEAEGSDVRFLALYDSATGLVRLTGLSGAVGPDQDFELWAIDGDSAPMSMGVIEAGAHSQVDMSDDVRAVWGEGTILAITIEPLGGSPTGNPSGAPVALGAATRV